MTITLEVLNPVGALPPTQEQSLAPRLSDLRGAHIAILNNIKPGADMLQPYLEQELTQRNSNIEVKAWRVPFHTPQDLKDPMLAEIAQYADGAIALVGD